MKLIKTMLAGMVLLVFAVGQEMTDGGPPPPPPCDPNATYPVADPGPDGGCGNYNDCNGNGAYDLGEPCGDMPMNDPVWEAFSSTLENGGSPDDAFEAAAAAVYDMNVATGNATEEEFEEGKATARTAFDQALADGKSPEEAFGDAMAAAGGPPTGDGMEGDHDGMEGDHDGGPPPTCDEMDMNGDGVIDREEARDKFGDDPNFDQRYDEVDTNGDGVVDCGEHDAAVAAGPDGGPPTGDGMEGDHDGMEGDHDGMEGDHDGMEHMGPAPTNHWDGNCGAMMSGEDEYWLDSDGDGSPEDGPYAVWYEDADGNPVDCGPGPGDHDGGDNSGDCGGFPGDEDGSIMVALPDGSERWLQVGEYTMNDDGSVTVNRPGDPDDGATVTPPPCDDSGNSNN